MEVCWLNLQVDERSCWEGNKESSGGGKTSAFVNPIETSVLVPLEICYNFHLLRVILVASVHHVLRGFIVCSFFLWVLLKLLLLDGTYEPVMAS